MNHMDTVHRTCDSYCQAMDCVCVGAWDDDLDTCHQLSYHNCDHDFGAYTTDAICECNPHSASGHCPGGASQPHSTPLLPPTLATVTSPTQVLGGLPCLPPLCHRLL